MSSTPGQGDAWLLVTNSAKRETYLLGSPLVHRTGAWKARLDIPIRRSFVGETWTCGRASVDAQYVNRGHWRLRRRLCRSSPVCRMIWLPEGGLCRVRLGIPPDQWDSARRSLAAPASLGGSPRRTANPDRARWMTDVHRHDFLNGLLAFLLVFHGAYGVRNILLDLGVRRERTALLGLHAGGCDSVCGISRCLEVDLAT